MINILNQNHFMKQKNNFHLIAGVLIIFILSFILPSCVVIHAKKIDTQKRSLMLQDKSEYSRNKGKFKGWKKHKSQKKSMKKSGHRH